jgi:hypothetical protein
MMDDAHSQRVVTFRSESGRIESSCQNVTPESELTAQEELEQQTLGAAEIIYNRLSDHARAIRSVTIRSGSHRIDKVQIARPRATFKERF